MYRVHIFKKYNALSWNIQILANTLRTSKVPSWEILEAMEVLWRSQSFFVWKMIYSLVI